MAEGTCCNGVSCNFELTENRDDSDNQKPIIELRPEHSDRKEFVAPTVGMEFESYEDAYSYYNYYAWEVGFRVRVKNSWFKRNSRDKYGAVLCCSNQGFKRKKEVNRLRKETRTGCPAMVRIRLVHSQRWRVIEVSHEHNHSLNTKLCKSTKLVIEYDSNAAWSSDSDQKKVELLRALVVDRTGDISCSGNGNSTDIAYHLKLRKGDSQAIYNFFCRMQLTNPNFFYSMDLTDDGKLRNIFWIDSRSKASSAYFGDVIAIDTTYISQNYEVPLVTFVGINHHGQSVLLGCGLLDSETTESYTWLLKSWMKCTSKMNPLTIVTDMGKSLQNAVVQVFPRSHHRYGLSYIMRKLPEKLGGLRNYDAIRISFAKTVYNSLKVTEFEAAWRFMVQRFGVCDHKWLRSLYEERFLWAPVYLKDTFFAGIFGESSSLVPFFDRYVHKQTPLKEFLDKYELALQRNRMDETQADMESRNGMVSLRTRCVFEEQVSKSYTRELFRKIQIEIEELYSCFSTTSIHVDGPNEIFLVKERVIREGNTKEVTDYEVLYDKSCAEVRCICSCFNFHGYLCRHGLCVLHFNGVEEIPPRYLLPRWMKDYKCMPMEEEDASLNDESHWFSHLYRTALRFVEEGSVSFDHYNAALRALDDSAQ